MAQVFQNNFSTTLAAPITASDTIIELEDGSALVALQPPDFILLTLDDGSGEAWEIVKVTAHVANSGFCTVIRAQEGTTALAWVDGSAVEARLTAGTLQGLGGDSFAYAFAST